MGQQLIYVYFELKRRVEEHGYEGDLVHAICDYLEKQGPDFSVQKSIANPVAPYGCEDRAEHDVEIVPDTLLHRVMKRDSMRISSYHKFNTPPEQKLVTINAWFAVVISNTDSCGRLRVGMADYLLRNTKPYLGN